ncbi:hypothetical protein ACOWO9_06200 [Leuconostoc mesenteroides]|uniref:hypothetical protein n=1 Tax=Leuconostoc mesenteroides TaxID=1245 RepID=UPI003C566B38
MDIKQYIKDKRSDDEFNILDKDIKTLGNRDVKNSTAVPSAAGWYFQIITAIICALDTIMNLDYIKVEGEKEDIEVYFNNNVLPKYIQVKHSELSETPKRMDFLKKALTSLLTTSIETKGKYSNLVYACNFQDPIKFDNSEAYFSFKKELIEQNAIILPQSAQEKIAYQFMQAQLWLHDSNKGNGYEYNDKFFDWEKFIIATINDTGANDATQYQTLFDKIEILIDLAEMEISSGLKKNLFDYCISSFYKNAKMHRAKIKKIDIINPLFIFTMRNIPMTNIATRIDEDEFDVELITTNYGDFIENISENHSIFLPILDDFEKFKIANNVTVDAQFIRSFILKEIDFLIPVLKKHNNTFTADEYRIIAKILTHKVVLKSRNISKIKKGTGLS